MKTSSGLQQTREELCIKHSLVNQFITTRSGDSVTGLICFHLQFSSLTSTGSINSSDHLQTSTWRRVFVVTYLFGFRRFVVTVVVEFVCRKAKDEKYLFILTRLLESPGVFGNQVRVW